MANRKFSDSDATRIISALEARSDRKYRDGAQVATTWGTVGAVDTGNMFASAYLFGETDGAYMSEGFRIPQATYLTVGDVVKVAINYETGERWIAEAHYPNTAYKKYIVKSDGRIEWGDGTAAQDVNLYRAGADVLRTDDAIRSRRTNATDEAFGAHESASTTLRWSVLADGKMQWQPTSGAADVNLYRYGVNALGTDDQIRILNISGLIVVGSGGYALRTALVDGDANPALAISSQGIIEWGAGGASAVDTNLKRLSANRLGTDDWFGVARTNATDIAYSAHVSGDSEIRLRVLADGKMAWGDGTTLDTGLERFAANTLGVPAGDEFRIGGAAAGETADGIRLKPTGSIELAADAGTPYIDFKNDLASTDFDARIILAANDTLRVDGADLDIASGFQLTMAGTQVMTTRRTGWGAPTGTATRTTFATTTVTTAQLAERVKALIDDLTTHGMIGA